MVEKTSASFTMAAISSRFAPDSGSATGLAWFRSFGALLRAFGGGLADALNHAFGNPREEAAHLPPLVGVQPYRDRPRRRRDR